MMCVVCGHAEEKARELCRHKGATSWPRGCVANYPRLPEMAQAKELGHAGPQQAKQEAGWKYDAGKARIDLIAPEFIFGTAEVLAFGAQKYGERNWEKGMSWSRPFGALMRHMWAWWGGKLPTKENFLFGDLDLETAKSHLWHGCCCLMFLVAFEARSVGTDDRAK